MSNEDCQQRYEELLQQRTAEAEGDDAPPGDSERRDHPRFQVQDTELAIDVRLRVQVTDISRSGCSFYTDHHLQSGQVFSTSIGGVFSVNAQVLDCTLEETDADLMEARYRVRCHFVDQELDVAHLLTLIDR